VTCNCDICDHHVTCDMYLSCIVTCVIVTHDIILHSLSKSKIKKSKSKNQNKIEGKIEKKNNRERK